MTTNIIHQHPAHHDLFAGLVPIDYISTPSLPDDAPADVQHFNHEGVELAYSATSGKCYRLAFPPNTKNLKFAKWNLITPGTLQGIYTQIQIGSSKQKLHRIIAQHFLNNGNPLTSSDHIDHRQHADGTHQQDALNNLRITDSRGNGANRKDGTSKFAGVCWNSRDNKWRTRIRINNQRKHIGYFKSEYEAARAYILTGEEYGFDMQIARERFQSITEYAP